MVRRQGRRQRRPRPHARRRGLPRAESPPSQPEAHAKPGAPSPAEPRSSSHTAPEAALPAAPAGPPPSSLKQVRERLGLSQAELGEKLGLARSSVANYENGRAPLSQRLRKWMAKYEKKLDDRG